MILVKIRSPSTVNVEEASMVIDVPLNDLDGVQNGVPIPIPFPKRGNQEAFASARFRNGKRKQI
jgi:hypothetical protein